MFIVIEIQAQKDSVLVTDYSPETQDANSNQYIIADKMKHVPFLENNIKHIKVQNYIHVFHILISKHSNFSSKANCADVKDPVNI